MKPALRRPRLWHGCLAWTLGLLCAPSVALSAVVPTVPYVVSEPVMEEAFWLAEKGRHEAAARKVMLAATVPHSSRSYLAAHLQMQAGSTAEAARAFIALADVPSELQGHSAYWAGNQLRVLGRHDEAIPWLRRSLLQPGVRGKAVLELADSLERTGQMGDALGFLTDVVSHVADPDQRDGILARAADVAAASGRQDWARQLWFQMVLSGCALADRAGQQMREAAGDGEEALGQLLLLVVGDKGELTVEMDRCAGGDGSEKLRFRHAVAAGELARSQRKLSDAQSRLETARELASDLDEECLVRYLLGRTLESQNRDLDALTLYDEILKSSPAWPLVRFILLRSAAIAIREGEALLGLTYLDRFFDTSFPGEDQSTALWMRGHLYFLAGLYPQAEKAWLRLERRYFFYRKSPWEYYGPMARFWRSEALLRQGKERKALRLRRALVTDGWGSYYGMMSARDPASGEVLLPEGRPAAYGVSPLEVPSEVSLHPRHAAGIELFRLGLWEEAFDELRERVGTGGFEAGTVDLMAAAWFRTRALSTTRTFRRAVGLLPAPWRSGARLWSRSLPLVYLEQLDSAARLSGLHAALVASVVRFESGFNPDTVSRAGAVGLLQVKPRTGAMVGERCEQITRKIGSRQLRDPDTNLAVGSLYLAALGDRHGDNWPLALAAFNAGPGNAKRWLDRFAGLGTASWVEHLTYPGTVGYLKRILSCVWPYWSLYFPALGSASPAVRIPETIPDTLSPYLDEEGGNCYTH